MLSEFRISRERKVTLAPALKVWGPRMWVTWSRNWRFPRFVTRGWPLPRVRIPCWAKPMTLMPVNGPKLALGMPIRSARGGPESTRGTVRRSKEL